MVITDGNPFALSNKTAINGCTKCRCTEIVMSMFSGCAHGTFENDVEALNKLRDLMSFLPQSNKETPTQLPSQDVDSIPDIPFLDQVRYC